MNTGDKFSALRERLDSEGIAYTIEDTGSGCLVLFVRNATGSLISVAPTERPDADPRYYWQASYSPTEDDFWTGASEDMGGCLHQEWIVEAIREHMA